MPDEQERSKRQKRQARGKAKRTSKRANFSFSLHQPIALTIDGNYAQAFVARFFQFGSNTTKVVAERRIGNIPFGINSPHKSFAGDKLSLLFGRAKRATEIRIG